VESAASPVSVRVRAIVVMSGTLSRRATAFWSLMPRPRTTSRVVLDSSGDPSVSGHGGEQCCRHQDGLCTGRDGQQATPVSRLSCAQAASGERSEEERGQGDDGSDCGQAVGACPRFAKDHRDRIDRFIAMDNIPTRIIAETYDVSLARQGYWFFSFLGAPDLPEALIAGREEVWLTHFYRSWSYNPEMLTPEDIAVCVRAYQQPGAVRGSCMEYRAAPQDVAQDREDADQLIDCPVLTMWGGRTSAPSDRPTTSWKSGRE
jgi:hypothetical protein